jgi:DNA anti-recombination protein RmuC
MYTPAMDDLTSDANVSYIAAAIAIVISLLVFATCHLRRRLAALHSEHETARGFHVHVQTTLDATRTQLRDERRTTVELQSMLDDVRNQLERLQDEHRDQLELIKYKRDEALDALEACRDDAH